MACAQSLRTQAEAVVVQFRTRKICFLVRSKKAASVKKAAPNQGMSLKAVFMMGYLRQSW